MKRSRVRFSQAAPPKPQVNHPVGLGFSRLPGADVVARCCWSWPDVPYRNRTDPDRIRARHGSVTPRMVGPATPTPEFADLLVAETRQPDRCSCPATCICQVDVYLAAGGETRCCGAAEGERKGPREGRGRGGEGCVGELPGHAHPALAPETPKPAAPGGRGRRVFFGDVVRATQGCGSAITWRAVGRDRAGAPGTPGHRGDRRRRECSQAGGSGAEAV